jgi:hypothetical protein
VSQDSEKGPGVDIVAIVERLQEQADEVVLQVFEDRRRQGLDLADHEINMMRKFITNRLRRYVTQAVIDSYSVDRYPGGHGSTPPEVLAPPRVPDDNDWPSGETMRPPETEEQKRPTKPPPRLTRPPKR